MQISFSPYNGTYLTEMTKLWNEVIEDGIAFPGIEFYDDTSFEEFLKTQSAVTCLLCDSHLAGFYILHPNNIGRCSHIANASYCINSNFRGKNLFHSLVEKSLEESKELGFRGLQYNAVVATNYAAIRTYTKSGFEIIGTIPGGFQLKDGSYSNMYVMFKNLV